MTDSASVGLITALHTAGHHIARDKPLTIKIYVGSDDADFDKRLDALKKGKGATAYGKSRQDKQPQQSPGAQPKGKKKQGAHPEL